MTTAVPKRNKTRNQKITDNIGMAWSREVVIYNADTGLPDDLTGKTVAGYVNDENKALKVTLAEGSGITIVNERGGVVNMAITAAAKTAASMVEGKGTWWLTVADAGGEPKVVASGIHDLGQDPTV